MTKIAFSPLLSDLDFCVIDLETTGGNLKTDRIIEIGIAHVQNFKILSSKSYFVNPQKKIPDFIQKLTSITDEDVKDAPTIDKIIDEIREFIGEKIVVAHNISFDIPFFNAVLKKLKKKPLKNNILCTNVMTKHLIPGITNSNLPYLCDIFNIKHARAHHAHDDALATAELLITYLKVFSDRNIRKVNQLYYPKNKFEFDKYHQVITSDESWDIITKKVEQLSNPFYVSLKGKTGEILFASYFDEPAQFMAEINTIKNLKIQTNMISIKLYGSNLEALLHLKESYAKCSPAAKERIANFLWARPHLNEIQNKVQTLVEQWGKDYYQNLNNMLVKDYYLIVTRHLIDGQLMLLHSPHFSYKNSAIFKFSSQKRKLIQHIEQLHKKDFSHYKVNERTFADNSFSLLWVAHLLIIPNSKDCLVIPHQELSLGNESLENKIHKFIDKTKNKHRYPMHHL
jgi:DNA polymerase-3 subunit epsilon